MRILFVSSVDDAPSPRYPLTSFEPIQMGISYISAYLKSKGHQTALVLLASNFEKTAPAVLDDAVKSFAPQLIAFSSVFSQYPFLARMARRLKQTRPDIYRLIGGPHPSLCPADVMADDFDALCVGEGIYPAAELAAQLEAGQIPHQIPNLWLNTGDGRIEKNPTRPFMRDIDTLPFADRDIWLPWIKEDRDSRMSVLLAMGCPYECTYCSNHALKKLATGPYVRFRSPDKITAEIRGLHERFPEKRYYYLEIEAIGLNKKWAIDLCRRLAAYNATLESPHYYHCNFRVSPQSVDETLFSALAQANVHTLNIGLEAGSERVRRDVLKRNYNNADFLKAVAMARAHNMQINLFNMIGVPGETRRDHRQTVRLNRLSKPQRSNTSIFFPYPGTRLYETCRTQGLLPDQMDVQRERRQAVLDLPGFSRHQIQHAYLWFDYRIQKENWPWHVRLRKLIQAHLLFYRFTNRLFWRALPLWKKIQQKLGLKTYGRDVIEGPE